MRHLAIIGFGFALFGAVASASAADCPGNPDAIGTSRVITIDQADYPLVGQMQYRQTLPLADHEVVLTFDDGPLPPYTTRILETLAAECVKANYFIIGRMARGYPALLKRIHAEGHVIGTHSENHLLAFHKMPMDKVEREIEQGIASTGAALGDPSAVAPFFRIPGLLRRDEVETYLRSRHLVSWSADVPADDWKHISASEVVRRAITRLEAKGRGIILLHDIQPATALALPTLLKELKKRGYKIVQVKPAASSPPLIANLPPPTAATASNASVLAEKPLPTSAWPTALAPSRPKLTPSPEVFEAHVPPNEPGPPPAKAPIETASTIVAVKAPPNVQSAMPPLPEPAVVKLPDVTLELRASVQPAAPAVQSVATQAQAAEPALRALMQPQPMATMPAPVDPLHESLVMSRSLTPQTTRPLTPTLKPSNSSATTGKSSTLLPGEQARTTVSPGARMAFAKASRTESRNADVTASIRPPLRGDGRSSVRPGSVR